MPRSKIPSPARSESVKVTPRRHRFRSSRSVSSPARSDVSVKLSSIVQMHAMESLVLSPLRTRRSVLSDNTDIEVPGRQSWWRRLDENSRDVMEVFESKATEQPDNVEEYIDADFKSQENDYTVDLPESSDGESVTSIILPKRKFFSQKQTQSTDLFHKIIENRENLTHRKSKANVDNTIFVGKKNLFNRGTEEPRSRPTFPAGLLNMTEDKTPMNKTHDVTKHGQIRNLLGNRAGTKRKNMFAQFIMSESEDEIPDIQPNITGFSKSKQQQQRKMSVSRSTRNTSPTSNETDLEFDEWQHLPSSTMVDSELGNIEDNSPVKRPRLSKADSVIEAVQGNVRNKLNKTKQANIVLNNPENENELVINANMKQCVSKSINEKTLIQNAENDNLGQSAAEVIQVDSDDDSNFILRYDNDYQNMQENDVMDITVKESQKISITNEKNSSATKKVLHSPPSLKGDETKATSNNNNQIITQPISVVNVEEDLLEKEVNNKTNTSISTTNRQDACDKIDNREKSIVIENSSFNNEKTYFEPASMNMAEEEPILERNRTDVVIQESATSGKSFEKTHKSSLVTNTEVDGEDNVSKALNKTLEVENHNYEEKNIDHTDPCIETDINDISGDIQNLVNESVEKIEQNKTSTDINVEGRYQNTNDKNKLNESTIEASKQISIPAIDERNETICKENHEKDTGTRQSTDNTEILNKSNRESQQKALSMDENMDSDDDDNNVSENLTKDENTENEAVNKSHEESDKEMASVDENIETDDEESKDDSEELEGEDEQQKDDENAEESEIQNETNDENDKQTGISSMDVNIETEDEDPEDSDNERNDDDDNKSDDDDDDDNKAEDEVSNENNEDLSNQIETSSTNKSIEMENGENNEDDENHAEDNEINESNEDISNDIGRDSVNENIETEDEENDDENRDEMNLENDRQDDSNAKTDNQVTFSKGRIYLTNVTGESNDSLTEEVPEETDHEESETRQLALEQYLMKIKNDNIEKRRKMEEEVRNSLKASSREPFNQFKVPVRTRPMKHPQRTDMTHGQTKTKPKKQSILNIENLPPELLDDMKYKPPRRYQPKNASWITKRLYKYLESKLEPKYDYKARVISEKLVESIYEFTKEVRRHRVAPPSSVDVLKQQLARTGVLHTHYDFYKFFHDFMPREIRVKVVPDVVNEISLPRHGVFSNIM